MFAWLWCYMPHWIYGGSYCDRSRCPTFSNPKFDLLTPGAASWCFTNHCLPAALTRI